MRPLAIKTRHKTDKVIDVFHGFSFSYSNSSFAHAVITDSDEDSGSFSFSIIDIISFEYTLVLLLPIIDVILPWFDLVCFCSPLCYSGLVSFSHDVLVCGMSGIVFIMSAPALSLQCHLASPVLICGRVVVIVMMIVLCVPRLL